MPGIANKLKLLFKPPGWRADNQQIHCNLGKETVDLTARFDPRISTFNLVYTSVQFLFTIVLSLTVLLGAASLSYSLVSLAVIYLFFSFFVAGAWLEGKEFALTLEIVRLAFFVPCLLLLDLNPAVTALLISNAIVALPLLLIMGSKRPRSLSPN
jgi:hypothetical protein